MTEKKRKPRQKHTYVPRNNALHITIYHPRGENVLPEVFEECESAILDTVLKHGLLTGRATT